MATKMYDLGSKPSKMENMGVDEKKSYPCLYEVNMDNYPPLGDMKLGDTGKAVIEFNIKPSGGIEITSMGPMGTTMDDTKTDKSKKSDGSSDEGTY